MVNFRPHNDVSKFSGLGTSGRTITELGTSGHTIAEHRSMDINCTQQTLSTNTKMREGNEEGMNKYMKRAKIYE